MFNISTISSCSSIPLMSRPPLIVRQLHGLHYVPHQFSRAEACKRFVENDKARLFAPVYKETTQPVLHISNVEPLRKTLVPMYRFQAETHASVYKGEFGIERIVNYWVSDGKGGGYTATQIVIDWHPISGIIPGRRYAPEEKAMSIYGGFTWPSHLIEKALRRRPIGQLKPFDEASVESDIFVDPFLKRAAIAHEIAQERIRALEIKRACENISTQTGYYHTRVNRIKIVYNSFQASSLLLPAYVLQFPGTPPRVMSAFGDKVKIAGAGSLSISKCMSAGMAAASILSLIIPGALPIRLGTIVVGAAVSGLWASYGPTVRQAWQKKRLAAERENNESVAESNADKSRREATEKFQPQTAEIEGLDPALLELVGLDPAEPVTEEKLQAAFHQRVKQIHPDRQPGSSKQTQAVIHARDRLLADLRRGKRHYSHATQVKEPPRSTAHPRAGELITAVLDEKNYSKALALIKQEVPVDGHDEGENTLLTEAAKQGDIKAIRFAIENKASPDTSCDCPFHRTALHYAVANGHVEAVKVLLELGANPNLINSHGQTPLDLAKTDELKHLLQSYGGVANHASIWRKLRGFLIGYSSNDRTILLTDSKKEKAIPLPPSQK